MTCVEILDPQKNALLLEVAELPEALKAYVRQRMKGGAAKVVVQEFRSGRVRYRRPRLDEVGVSSASVHEVVAGRSTAELETAALRFDVGTGQLAWEGALEGQNVVRFTRGARRSRWSFVCPACGASTERLHALAAHGLNEALELRAPRALVGCRKCLGLVYPAQAEHKTARGDERLVWQSRSVGVRERAMTRLIHRDERALERELKEAESLLRLPGFVWPEADQDGEAEPPGGV